jgi:hypothetical protein
MFGRCDLQFARVARGKVLTLGVLLIAGDYKLDYARTRETRSLFAPSFDPPPRSVRGNDLRRIPGRVHDTGRNHK